MDHNTHEHCRARFGFPARREYRFRLNGRRYRVGPSGIRTLRLLSELTEIHSSSEQRSASRRRDRIRASEMFLSRSVLCLVIDRTDDRWLRLLAIWLRGRVGGSLGTAVVARFATHPDDQTRKEVARALRRMSAWAHLRDMAENDSCARIRRLATTRPAQSYHSRLSRYCNHIPLTAVESLGHRLFVSPDLDIREGRRPKSRFRIRLILKRIQQIVAG